jgi:K+-transporting ATPase KdpF subunit
VRPGGPVILDLLAGIVAALVLVYLVWALLRPEDF